MGAAGLPVQESKSVSHSGYVAKVASRNSAPPSFFFLLFTTPPPAPVSRTERQGERGCTTGTHKTHRGVCVGRDSEPPRQRHPPNPVLDKTRVQKKHRLACRGGPQSGVQSPIRHLENERKEGGGEHVKRPRLYFGFFVFSWFLEVRNLLNGNASYREV